MGVVWNIEMKPKKNQDYYDDLDELLENDPVNHEPIGTPSQFPVVDLQSDHVTVVTVVYQEEAHDNDAASVDYINSDIDNTSTSKQLVQTTR